MKHTATIIQSNSGFYHVYVDNNWVSCHWWRWLALLKLKSIQHPKPKKEKTRYRKEFTWDSE